MDFGLGLVLSFTDNASAGMNNAVQSLAGLTSVAEQASESLDNLGNTASLMAVSSASSMIGNNLIRTGTGMLGLFTRLINKTQQLGSEYEGFGITLNALGMNAQEGIKKLFAFANKSPLEVGDVKDMLVTLQAQGIDAFQETTGAISGTRQEFLAFLTDLAAFKPEVPMERFKMAIQNYIGSGEKKMIRTAFDMGDIEDIIGHAVSDTAEGRMQDIVEMVENKGLTGLSKSLSNSWQGVASNIDDAFTRIYYSVANDGGVFEKLKESFVGLAKIIIDLPEEKLAKLGKTIGDALNTIVTPITKAIKWFTKLANTFINLVDTRPNIMKWGIVLTTVAGISLVFAGVVMKLVGSLASFVLVMQNIGGTVSTVSNMFKNGFATMASSIAPLVLTIGLFAVAWKTDFAGIRSMTVNFFNNIIDSFSTARKAIDGSMIGFRATMREIKKKDDFWSNITLGLMKIYGTFKFVSEAWNNDFTLSDDSFQKATQLGILPLISRILDLLYRFQFFKRGFIAGWNEIGTKVKLAVEGMLSSLKGTSFQPLIDGVTAFLTALTNNDASAWEQAGKAIGEMIAKGLILAVVFKGISSIVKKLSIAFTTLKTVGGIFEVVSKSVTTVLKPLSELKALISGSSLIPSSGIGKGFLDIATKIFKIKDAFLAVAGFISSVGVAPILAVVAVITTVVMGLVAFVVTQKDKFLEMIGTIKTHISDAVSNIIKGISTAFNYIKSAIEPAIGVVSSAFGALKESVSSIGEGMADSPIMQLLGFIGESILGNIIPVVNILIDLVGTVLSNAFAVAGAIIGGVITAISNVLAGIVDVVTGVINVVSGLLSLDFDKVGKGLLQVGTGIIQAFTGLVGGILTILGGVVKGVFNIGKDIITGLLNGIKDRLSYIWDIFTGIIDTVKGIFGVHSPSTVFAEIGGYLIQGLINGVQNLIGTFASIFTNTLNTILTIVKTVFNGLRTIASAVLSFLVSGTRGKLNAVKTIFTTVFSMVSTIVSTVFNGIKNSISTVLNSIKSTVENILGTVKNVFFTVFDAVSTKISNIFTGIYTTVSGIMTKVRETISGALDTIKKVIGATKFELPHIKVPHFNISGGEAPFGIGGKGTKPSISIDWYAKGGVFDKPSLIGVGENGKEAVMPLEKNTGWISDLASMLSSRMVGLRNTESVQQVSSVANSSTNNINNVVTRNNTTNVNNNNSSTKQGNVTTNVTFSSGSIIIQAKDFTEAEAERFATMIMNKIKRQTEIDRMLNYA